MSAAQIAAARLNDPQGPTNCFGYPCMGVEFLNGFKRVLKGFKNSLKGGQAMVRKASRISRQKIALIHVAAHRLGVCDADYRALLMGAAGVRSARDLDKAGFEAVMRRFEALGFTSARPAAPQYGWRPGMATPAQVRAILAHWRGWHHTGNPGADASETARALRHWLERHYHVTDLRFCDVTTAQKAIEGLKAMHERQQRATSKSTGKKTHHE